MKKINLTNISFIAFAFVLLLLSIVTYRKSLKRAEASDWVLHSQLIKLRLSEAYVLFLTAETNQRGFLLTEDSAFLRRFYTMKTRVLEKLSEVKDLASDNPQQQKNIDSLASLFKNRYYWMQMVIDSKGPGIANIQSNLLRNGQVMTNQLARQIEYIKNQEDRLLDQRMEHRKEQERTTSTFILLFSVFSVLFILFSFFRLRKETRELRQTLFSNKKLEQHVQERTRQVREANQALEAQNIELQKKNAELSSFTFVASHDLKEPLRKIEIYSSLLEETDKTCLSDKGNEYLQKIKFTVGRMKVLLEAIFTYAQTDKIIESEKVDLNETAAMALNTLQEKIQEMDALVEYSGLPVLKAIPYQMEQLFTNIISNALKYAKSGVRPVIRVEAKKISMDGRTAWEISFTDNGIGFNNKYSEKIFEIFQRLHPKATYSGTGIGLAICKKIAENHNGSIRATSKEGEGAVFTVTLPEN